MRMTKVSLFPFVLCHIVLTFHSLYAAINDLALLINTLDLQVSPSTPNMTSLRASPLPADKVADYNGSPKKGAFVQLLCPVKVRVASGTLKTSTVRGPLVRSYL